MANKFYGKVGYAITEEVETQPGVWKNTITERNVTGELIKVSRRLENTNNLNNDIVMSNQVSILADPFEVQYPRLLLTLGGVYNGE